MFKELKKVLDKFYELEEKIKNNQKSMDKIEADKYSLEKKLSLLIEEYYDIKSINDSMIREKREMEIIINEMIKNINK